MIYIGTHNPEKAKSIKATLRLVDKSIQCADIFSFGFPTPKEDGENEIKRSQMKASYYWEHLVMPVISEDDGFYFKESIPVKNLSVSDTDTANLSKFDFWNALLKKNSVTGGVLRKAYSIHTKDTRGSTIIDIPFSVDKTAKDKKRLLGNILNIFIVPEGFKTPIAHMTKADKKAFRMKYIVPAIGKLLDQVNVAQNHHENEK